MRVYALGADELDEAIDPERCEWKGERRGAAPKDALDAAAADREKVGAWEEASAKGGAAAAADAPVLLDRRPRFPDASFAAVPARLGLPARDAADVPRRR